MAEQRIEIMTLSEPRWSDTCAEAGWKLSTSNYGDVRVIEDLPLMTYATPRVPDDALAEPLRAAGIMVIAVGDARAPQEMPFATASGHAAGEAA